MEKISKYESTEVQLAQIKQGDDFFLKELYESKRAKFISWFQKNHHLDKSQAVELFQKAFTIFYFNVKDGKISSLKSTIDTYLFGVGKILVKEELRSRNKTNSIEELQGMDFGYDDFFLEEEASRKETLVQKILANLEEPCKSLLIMFYFHNFSMQQIASRLGYKNEGVTKKKKCLCLKMIRKMMLESNVEWQ